MKRTILLALAVYAQLVFSYAVDTNPSSLRSGALSYFGNGIYRTEFTDTEFVPTTSLGESIILEDDQFVLIRHEDNGDVLVQFFLGQDENGPILNTLTIALDDFLSTPLKFVGLGDLEALREMDSIYERTPMVRRTGGQARTRGHRRGRRMIHMVNGRVQSSGCLAYVQKAIGWNKPGSVGGASNFASVLHRAGWKKTNCHNPPVGAVASWRGKHTALWNGRCWAYDIGCGDPGSRYGAIKLCVVRE